MIKKPKREKELQPLTVYEQMRLSKVLDALNRQKNFDTWRYILRQNDGRIICQSKYHVIRDTGHDDGYITVNVKFFIGYPANVIITVPQADNHNYRFGAWPKFFREKLTAVLQEQNILLSTMNIVRRGKFAMISMLYNDFCIQKKVSVTGRWYGQLVRTFPDKKMKEYLFTIDSVAHIDYKFYPRTEHQLINGVFKTLDLPKSDKDYAFLRKASKAPRVNAFKLGMGGFNAPWIAQPNYKRI